MTKSFVVFREESEDWVDYPSQSFSDKTGVKLSQDWNIPGDDLKIQRELVRLNKINSDESWTIQPIQNFWRNFVSLNPQIENWIIDGKGHLEEARQKWEIMFGMVSKYNEDDIRSFLSRKGSDVSPADRRRIKNIEKTVGCLMCWVPSKKTLRYIEDSL
jgi:hypothetical protein